MIKYKELKEKNCNKKSQKTIINHKKIRIKKIILKKKKNIFDS